MATDPVVLAARLVEAEDALHQLSTGKLEATVQSSDGKQVIYSRPQIGALRAYIAELKLQINPADATARRRPLRPFF